MKVKQHDITDCGAACLASVAIWYGLKLPIARIRQIASTDKKGTNMLGMVEAAGQLGFSAKAVKAIGPHGEKWTAPLEKIPKPAIAHVVVNKKLLHYVVLYKANGKKVSIMDPADGKMHRYSYDEFTDMWTGILLLLAPMEEFKRGNQKVSVLTRLWHLFRPNLKDLTQAIFGAAVYTVIGLSTSIYVQKIVDNVIPQGNKNLLNLLSVAMMALLLSGIFINFFKTLIVLRTGQKIDVRLILGYYKHLLRLPQTFFDNMRSGEIISRVNDAVKIRLFINETMINLLVSILILLLSFALMFTYYWKLALIISGVIPLYTLVYIVYNYANRKTQRKLMEDSAELEAHLVESLNAVGTIKRFGMEDFAGLKTEARFVQLLHTVYRSGKTALWSGSSAEFISRLFTIILLWAGAAFVVDLHITPGELLSFYALIGYFMGPVGSLIGMNRSWQDARIAADRLFEIMDLEQEDGRQKLPFVQEQLGDIVFCDVHFRYGAREDVFTGLNLTFEQGKISAIVGESGSGKSSLLAILQNLYPLQKGHVCMGGVDVRHIAPACLRSLMGIVPQQIDLFDGSLLENIALGDLEPDLPRILALCEQIGLQSFIQSLPAGLHTQVGEKGAKLSGGQRQRIAIARALYRNPRILVLDEATSALDSESEQYIKHVIADFKANGKTVIIIAHRLATITQADTIYVLQGGRLTEQGSHQELLRAQGQYAAYWQAQTQYNYESL
ncbi:MAG: peptidase domain-containing ABC transporter [Bacteroidales bacterium]|nr:peptidase domain-containing ABC transporter [Bacteroidales bacterium]MCL2738857.1 peptidase domain-containing ABC transporter [Bacteroidales bacterium]